MNKEQEQLMEMVENIIDTILDFKSQGMSDFMIKEMMLSIIQVVIKDLKHESEEKEMLN